MRGDADNPDEALGVLNPATARARRHSVPVSPHRRGRLMIYHGVAGQILENVDHQPYVRYSAGAMLLDIDDPRTVIYRSPTPILAPETDDERAGIVPNVVFPTGIDLRENGRVDIYYGMADAAIGVARLDLPAQLDA